MYAIRMCLYCIHKRYCMAAFKKDTWCGNHMTVSSCAGIDTGRNRTYNNHSTVKEAIAMDFNLMEFTDKHPEREQIFCLAQMLSEAGYPFYFNFLDDLSPSPFNQDGGDPETDIDWDRYHFLIEIGNQAGRGLSDISVCFNEYGDDSLLELLDMRPAAGMKDPRAENGQLTCDLTAEQCMEIIEGYFENV